MYCLMLLTISVHQTFTERIPPFHITNYELITMSKNLREADENKARPGQLFINFQGHTTTRDFQDNASRNLFVYVQSTLLSKPSYIQFVALTNNFNRETGVAEPRVPIEEEERETANFLSTVLESKPWKILYEFLKRKGHPFANNPAIFRHWIGQLWFEHYSRAQGQLDTSGFEHVFMGEEKNNEISGLHNWIRFHMLEKNATENFDYKGFIIKRGKVMASIKFTWKGNLKRSGSLLIGTSPEFEMALYTLCFLSRRGREECQYNESDKGSLVGISSREWKIGIGKSLVFQVEIDGCPLKIISYELRQNNKVFIGTVFPTAGPLTEQCRRNG